MTSETTGTDIFVLSTCLVYFIYHQKILQDHGNPNMILYVCESNFTLVVVCLGIYDVRGQIANAKQFKFSNNLLFV